MYPSPPHVSPALRHLRFGVTASAAMLSIAIVLQVLIWCFVHFTDLRQARPQRDEARQAVPVVVTSPSSTKAGRGSSGGGSAPASSLIDEPHAKSEPNPVQPTPAQVLGATPAPAPVMNANDRLLLAVANLVQTIGIIAAIMLVVLMMQAVMVASGGGIPGVEMVVTAATWGLVIALLALPLRAFLPGASFPGVFIPYADLTSIVDAYRANAGGSPGDFEYFARFLLLPFALLLGLGALVLRYRAGVAAGIIVTSLNQLDEKLEQEIRAMKLGQLQASRAVGALNQAIGAAPVYDPASGLQIMQHPQAVAAMPPMPSSVPAGFVPQPAPSVPQAAAPSDPNAAARARSMAGQPAGQPLRRPI